MDDSMPLTPTKPETSHNRNRCASPHAIYSAPVRLLVAVLALSFAHACRRLAMRADAFHRSVHAWPSEGTALKYEPAPVRVVAPRCPADRTTMCRFLPTTSRFSLE
jgi:hypothetical protein